MVDIVLVLSTLFYRSPIAVKIPRCAKSTVGGIGPWTDGAALHSGLQRNVPLAFSTDYNPGMSQERRGWPSGSNVWRYVVVLTLAGWWGGLTFYGMVVVPEGTAQLGSQTQGLVTQQVTRTLNLIGVAVIGLLVFELKRSGTRSTWAAWVVFSVSQVVLFGVHAWLSALLEPATDKSVDWRWFYDVHRIYLIATALQWGAGLWLLWGVVRGAGSMPKG